MSKIDVVSSEYQDWQEAMDGLAELENSLELSDREKTIQLLALIARSLIDLNYSTLSMKEMLAKISLRNTVQDREHLPDV
ncbi:MULTISPECIES: hypothetical protein [Methylobacterium]|uniref:hypothetical protein n=1 Tax=Methylobacterium TaxID=407 RepID=UPI000A464845|nr:MULTISPECIES: hypothetical protein [Methylobacterium]MCI9880650.1 hypothetical protein [Methylobacterium goesingense]